MNSSLSLSFRDVRFDVVDRNGQPWLRGQQVADALGYKNHRQAIDDLYSRNSDEFTDAMTALVKLKTAGGLQEVRIFSPRGCYLLGMFARTEIAKEFRKWVLDVLEQHAAPPDFADPLSDFGPKAQFAVLEMLVNKVAQEIAGGFIDYLRTQPGRFTPESTTQRPDSPSRASYPRHSAPVDLWEPQVAAFVSDRQQVTTTLVLDHLGIPAAEQTQYPKNRIARILKNIGFACCIIKVGRKAQRVWMRTYHA